MRPDPQRPVGIDLDVVHPGAMNGPGAGALIAGRATNARGVVYNGRVRRSIHAGSGLQRASAAPCTCGEWFTTGECGSLHMQGVVYNGRVRLPAHAGSGLQRASATPGTCREWFTTGECDSRHMRGVVYNGRVRLPAHAGSGLQRASATSEAIWTLEGSARAQIRTWSGPAVCRWTTACLARVAAATAARVTPHRWPARDASRGLCAGVGARWMGQPQAERVGDQDRRRHH